MPGSYFARVGRASKRVGALGEAGRGDRQKPNFHIGFNTLLSEKYTLHVTWCKWLHKYNICQSNNLTLVFHSYSFHSFYHEVLYSET